MRKTQALHKSFENYSLHYYRALWLNNNNTNTIKMNGRNKVRAISAWAMAVGVRTSQISVTLFLRL